MEDGFGYVKGEPRGKEKGIEEGHDSADGEEIIMEDHGNIISIGTDGSRREKKVAVMQEGVAADSKKQGDSGQPCRMPARMGKPRKSCPPMPIEQSLKVYKMLR